jgi:TRAP-type mannitol/chloroaromatic compound transport system permease large subunit
MYLGVIPFVAIQIMALAVLWFVPSLATWLPHMLYD